MIKPQKLKLRRAELEEYERVLTQLFEDKIQGNQPDPDINEVKKVLEKIKLELENLDAESKTY